MVVTSWSAAYGPSIRTELERVMTTINTELREIPFMEKPLAAMRVAKPGALGPASLGVRTGRIPNEGFSAGGDGGRRSPEKSLAGC
jgi:hypothetical protein